MKHPRAGLRVRRAPRRASVGVVLAVVKVKPSGWPPAGLDPACGRGRPVRPPRQVGSISRNLTVFDSNGVAFEDHLALDVILQTAEQLGLGAKLSIESHPDDVLDPYSIRGHVPATATPS